MTLPRLFARLGSFGVPGAFVATSLALVGGWFAYFLITKHGDPALGDLNTPAVPSAPSLVKVGDRVGVLGDGTPAWGRLREEIPANVYQASPGSPTIGVIPEDTRVAPLPTVIDRSRIMRILAPKPVIAPITITWLSDPLDLQQGKTYRARLELSGVESALANHALVSKTFADEGFSSVRALRMTDLDTSWPSEATQNATSRTWFVEGVWGGASAKVDKPKQVERAWRVG